MELPSDTLSPGSPPPPWPAQGLARRAWLRQVGLRTGCALAALPLAGLGAWPGQAAAHDKLGPLTPPLPVPPLPLLMHDGRRSLLPELLRGRITALQLMFTGCSATCPIQGAAFAELQKLLRKVALPQAQLLSVSVDPLGDDPVALAAWRRRFGAEGLWLAGVPAMRHATVLPEFVLGNRTPARAQDSLDSHSAQVFLFDPQGRLAFRTAELASPKDVAASMVQLAARS